jgi:hypothetical protein
VYRFRERKSKRRRHLGLAVIFHTGACRLRDRAKGYSIASGSPGLTLIARQFRINLMAQNYFAAQKARCGQPEKLGAGRGDAL